MLKWHLRASGSFNIMNINSGFGWLICLYLLNLFQLGETEQERTRANLSSINLIDIPLQIHIYLIFKQIDKYKVTVFFTGI